MKKRCFSILLKTLKKLLMILVKKILMKKTLTKKIKYRRFHFPKHKKFLLFRLWKWLTEIYETFFWKKYKKFLILSLENLISWNIRKFFRVCFFFSSLENSMSQNVRTFFLRKINNVFNLGARKLHFQKYMKIFFSLKNFSRLDFLSFLKKFFELELKSDPGSCIYL